MHGCALQPHCRAAHLSACIAFQHTTCLSHQNAPHFRGSNSMTNIPSLFFGSKPKWHFKSEEELLTLLNVNFTLLNQNVLNICQPTSTIATRMISILRIMPFTLDDWRQLPTAGRSIGTIGKGIWPLWEWTLTYRIPPSLSKSDSSRALLHKSEQDTMVRENKPKIARSVVHLWLLARQSRWPATATLQR
jgi:hypothetical protein